jgi:pimeloyl-ACP methyl ester carboxylesterase
MTVLADVGQLDLDGVHAVVLGSGGPVTVFAHGLGGSAAETRPLAARVPGTRVLLEFRGHGHSAALDDGWTYAQLADDLLAVADATGATRAVGLSLGAGALLRLLSEHPQRFERLALVLPAALDATRADGATVRLQHLGAAIDRGDRAAVADLLLSEVPAQVRDRRGTRLLLARRAAQLVERPSPQPRHDDRPVHDRRLLGRVHAPTLVVAQEADPLHRLDVARELVAALPRATLLELPEGGAFWTAARDLQTALASHLGAA